MSRRKHYTKKELDSMMDEIIKAGKDIEFIFKGKKYIVDIKMLARSREFEKKYL